MGEKARALVEDSRGATERARAAISVYLDRPATQGAPAR